MNNSWKFEEVKLTLLIVNLADSEKYYGLKSRRKSFLFILLEAPSHTKTPRHLKIKPRGFWKKKRSRYKMTLSKKVNLAKGMIL